MTDTARAADVPRGRDVWSSKLGFILATAAAAIGLGSLWRFPYVAGANGGGAFVLIYIAFVAAICVPLMIAEMTMGRRGHGSVISTMRRLVQGEGASPAWKAIGWMSIAVPFFGLSYYSVVAGWGVDYARQAIFSGFAGIDGEGSRALFQTLIGAPVRQASFQFAFIMATAIVVALGVQRGIEFVSRIKMTALFLILLGMVLYNAFTVGLGQSIAFLIVPDFSVVTGASVLTALGQALFSCAIGAGVMMTYAAYLPKGVSVPQSAGIVSLSVVVISLMSGLAIFPIVLSSGLQPTEGPNLIFVTLPVAFGSMPGGRVISIFFFGLIALGAFTTAVGMLEPVVAWLMEATGLKRGVLAFSAAFAIWLVGLPSLLSFSVLKDVHPLAMLPSFANKTFFDILDFGIAETLLPLNALMIALFAGWALRKTVTPAEAGLTPRGYRLWHIMTGVVAPVAILGLMVDMLSR